MGVRRGLWVGAPLLACGLAALGQVTPPIERPALPEFIKPTPAPRIDVPVPRREVERSPRQQPGTFIRHIRVEGSTVFSQETLHGIVAPFEGQELSSEDMDEVRHRVSLAYANAGYINSGAVLPEQDFKDGELVLRIVEGRLTEVRVAGENTFYPGFIERRLAIGSGTPFNIRKLQDTIQILLQNPQIERINAELLPGVQRGEAVLRVEVKEAKRWNVGFSAANNRSPTIGAVRYELAASGRNLLGLGDSLSARVGHAHGLDDEALSYSVPITPYDTLLTWRSEKIRNRVIEPPFSLIDVRNKSQSTEIGLSQPIYRTPNRALAIGAGLYERDNATSLLGIPFSFTPGIPDGKSKILAARLFGDFLDRTQNSVLASRLTYTSGLNSGGATKSTTNTPDSQYWAVLAQVQWAKRLSEDGRQILVRADVQHASGELLPSEKFAIGGSETVRGYRENQIVRDNGWVASAEYRHPLGLFPIPGLKEKDQDGLLSLALFADFGRAWDHFGNEGRRYIWSVGPGFRWDVADGISAQVYYGARGKSVPLPKNNMQDHGIHFRFAFARAF
jgi:hemolysin activation/secretion protein